jgi:transcription factor SPN1
MPEAGNDPGDPLAPEIEEENSTPDPPLANPSLDMELTGSNEIDKDEELSEASDNDADDVDDVDDAASDNDDLESLLSEVDEAQFDDFDPTAAALGDRSALVVDETTVGRLGVHKRKRAEGDIGEVTKKKREARREKPKRPRGKRDEGSESFSGGEELEGKRRRKARPESDAGKKGKPAVVEAEEEEQLTAEESTFSLKTHPWYTRLLLMESQGESELWTGPWMKPCAILMREGKRKAVTL